MIVEAQHRGEPRKTGGSALGRWAGWAGLGLGAALFMLALAVAATAAILIALIGAAGMLALRLVGPRTKAGGDPSLLEGRRTAEGWIVEAAPRPR